MEYYGGFIYFKAETDGVEKGYGPHTGNIRIIMENLGGAGLEGYYNDAEGKIVLNISGECEYNDMINGLESIVEYLKNKRDES